jgi:drug/metabolite transporter (DMT)-like permease
LTTLPSSPYETVAFGTLCGVISAVGYTGANICLRSVVDVEPIWVSAMKSIPTVVLFGPYLLLMLFRGQRILPEPRVLLAVVLAGLTGQVFGNVVFQWALGVIGIALTVPLTLGALIVGGAVIGRVVLLEPVSRRSALAMGLLIFAIVLLSLGAGKANEAVAGSLAGVSSSSPWRIALAVLAACCAGLSYAVLGVVIRYGVQGRARLPVVLFTIGLMGMLALGGASVVRIGLEGMLSNTPREYLWMIGAGLCNVTAFFALSNALRLTSVVYVNALNASQAAMAAAAGYMFFDEPLTLSLLVGVGITAMGLLLMRKHESERRARGLAVPQAAPARVAVEEVVEHR